MEITFLQTKDGGNNLFTTTGEITSVSSAILHYILTAKRQLHSINITL